MKNNTVQFIIGNAFTTKIKQNMKKINVDDVISL